MNHIYRLVWSQVRRTWLVVSELARGRGKAGRTSTQRRTRVSAWWATLPLSLPLLALAAAPTGVAAPGSAGPAAAVVAVRPAIVPVASPAHPTGGQVTAGSGRIDYGDHLTTIQQNSQNLSLSWLSFNIGAQDTVNFLQPNAQSIAVNRIADPNGSVILGHLNANGQVFLINPNGVLFGKSAQVNVGGLVASTLDVSDSELGRGTLHFGGAGGGSVTNRGTITAAPGGYVALLGHAVSNQGAIHAPAGSVALAGGSAVTLNFDGSRLLDMQVDASTLNALAENKQLIVADGGQVLMSAGAKDSLLASVVNNSGTIQARTVENRAGKIVLLGGMEAGTTQVAGTLDASAPNGGDGGFIETSAAQVQVADGAKITTLAATGNNGTWLIDPTDFTIAASGGDITGTTLSGQLGGGNVTIQSTDGSAGTQGNINVNDTVSWGANTLTLNALNDINVNAAMNASGTAGLALAYGQAAVAAGNAATYHINAPINLASSGSFSTQLGSDGTAISYTIITSLGVAGDTTGTTLQGIGNNLAANYVLGTDIDASATSGWNGGAGFAPIGDSTTQFTGVFDGLGHTISDLTINRPTQDNVGLFGFVGGTLRNIGLVGGSVNGADYVGGLVGQVSSGNISNAYATGTVSGNNYIGGLLGYFGGTGSLSQSYATGNVSGVVAGSSYIGGLVGYNVVNINNAYATGDINLSGNSGYYIGGLVGYNGSTLKNVHATGNINLSYFGQYVGGLAGGNGSLSGYSLISNAYATGNISAGVGSGGGANYAGGLVGQNSSYIETSYATGNLVADPEGGLMWAGGLVGRNGESGKSGVIANAYATGNVDGGLLGMYLGGLAGQNYGAGGDGAISNAYSTGHVSGTPDDRSGGSVGENNGFILQSVYWNTETSGQSSAGAYTAGAIGLTSAQMLQIGSFGGFNSIPFTCSSGCHAGISATGGTGATWRIYEGHTTPLLSVFLTPYTLNAQPDFDGSGAALANIASVTAPTDPKILGSVTGGDTLTLAGLTAGGGYTASSNADLSGLYSTQQGYDLITSASRTISTPGSAAGEVRLDNGAIWNSGTLAIATAGNININGALSGDALHLNSGGAITDTNALNVSSFVLGGGNWNQIGATLPTFSATDFTQAGGSFVRALGGDGSSGTPYQLADVYGLQGVGTLQGDSFTLGNDIDASATTGWNGGAGFAPIGNSTTQFTGTFDGLGHTISDLTINRPTQDNVGLFGYTSTGSTISNVGLLSGSTTGRSEVGSLAGYNDGTINQAYATGAVSSSSYSGGLVGYNTGTINLAYATGAVNSSSYSGGLVGYNKGTISQAYATGTVSGAAGSGNSSLGGLVGANLLGAISQAYATGAVNGGTANRVGGLVGWDDRGMIDQVYATGAVNGGNYVGGLVGFGSGSISRTYATGAVSGVDYVGGLVGLGQTGSISQAYATGAVSGRNFLGGLVGSGGSIILGSYWDRETTGQTYGCSCYGDVTGLTTAQMMDPARFISWGIATAGGSTSVWRTYAGHTAPLLRAFMTPLALGSDNVSLVYNGSDQTSSNYTYGTLTPGFWLPLASVDASLILGSAGASLGARNVGNHALDLSPYSGQMGYDIDYTAGTLTITPATLTLSAVGDSKAYNGTTDSAGMVTIGGLLAGDSLAGLTQSFASKNVLGTNASTLGVDAGYVLDDGNGGGNYIIATHTAAGTITPYVVDLGGSRVYDGSTDVNAGDLVLGTLVGNETLTLFGTGSMADKNVGNGKSFALGTLTLSDGTGDAANYILAGGNDTVDISKRAITVDATGVDKVYDSTTADTVRLASTGLLVGDAVNFSGTGAFGDKNVGVAKAVGVSGIAATGADANNYSFNTTANTTADISQLGITVDATGVDKVYDGSTAATIVALGSTGLVVGDVVTFDNASAAFDDKNAGTGKTVTVNGIAASGADAGNYSFNTTANTTADISQLGITVDATGVNKVYDGSTAATITALGSTGLVTGDVVTFDNASAAFDDKNAGTGKTITVSGIAATGADAGNYSFNTTANTTADISQLGITVDATGSNKVYDGSAADTVALASAGVLSGDTVNFTGSGSFADKNAGTGKTVTVNGITASGRDANNYGYNAIATTTADVTPATLTYRADTAHFQAGQMPGDLSGAVTGLVGGDTLADATEGALTWQTPATASSPAGLYAIDGSGLSALNYLFEQAPENATALQVINGSASRVVTTIVAGLQQDETSPDDDVHTLHAPSVHIVDGGVRLP